MLYRPARESDVGSESVAMMFLASLNHDWNSVKNSSFRG